MKSILLIILLRGVALASSEQLVFSNDDEWVAIHKPKLRVCYFFENTPLHDGEKTNNIDEAQIEIKNNKYLCDFKDRIAKNVMLYYDKIYVCNINKGDNGMWIVPKLVTVVFDLTSFHSSEKNDFICFDVNNDISSSSFYVALSAGNKVERLVDVGLVINVILQSESVKWLALDIGTVSITDANRGLVLIDGNIRKDWSIKVQWYDCKVENPP